MCAPAAAAALSFGSAAVGAVGQAQAAKQRNAAAKRQYEHKLKIRERKWMMDRSLFKTKVVQFEKSISESNLAAQRAYTQSQINLNNIRVKALMDHQEDFRSMLEAEGLLEARAAERGVRGKSIFRALNLNLAKMGMANAQRSRALTQSLYAYEQGNEAVRRKLIGDKNNAWNKVSIQLVPDMAAPAPVYENPNSILAYGLLGAALDAGGQYASSKIPSISNDSNSGSKDGSIIINIESNGSSVWSSRVRNVGSSFRFKFLACNTCNNNYNGIWCIINGRYCWPYLLSICFKQ